MASPAEQSAQAAPNRWYRPGEHTQALTHYVSGNSDFLAVHFQDGPIQEYGVNGTTNEEVIEMLLDRLHSLNEMVGGKYACRENSLALNHLEEALLWLKRRTENRERRGVEGKNLP
jgi:hypothetical protein